MTTSVLAQSVQIGTYVELVAKQQAGTLIVGREYQTQEAGANQARRFFFARTQSLAVEVIQANDFVQSVTQTGGVPLSLDSAGNLEATLVLSATAGNAASLDVDGKLFVPTPAANYVTGVADTASATTTNTNGVIATAVKRSATSRNAIAELTDGLYARRLAIHPDSANYAEITTDDELIIKSLGIMNKIDGLAYSTKPAFVTALNSGAFVPVNPVEFGDILFLGGNQNYMYSGDGTAPFVAADFVELEGLELTESQVRAMVSAVGSIVYNPLTGVFSFEVSSTVGNDLAIAADGKAYVSVANAPVLTIDETGTAQTLSTKATFDDIYGQIAAGTTGATNGVTKAGANVELGGTMSKDTTINQGTKTLNFEGGAVNMASAFYLGAYTTDAAGLPIAAAGTVRMFVDVTNHMISYLPS